MRKNITVKKKRPVNLDLNSLKYPPMAIASILHRISGVALFVLLPVMLMILSKSLQSEKLFAQTKLMFMRPCYKIILWSFCVALIYHLLAGIRHLLIDMGYGDRLQSARLSAIFVIISTVILTIFLGILIW